MERIVKEIPLDCEIVLISDTHIGSKKAHITGIQRAVDFVKKKPNRFWIHLGDWIEAITTDDKRYETETTEQPIPELQAKEAIEIFEPIAGQGICGLLGNHERKLSRTINFGRMICEGLKIPYATESARVLFEHEGRLLFKFFITHGNKVFRSNAKDFIQREANKKAALKVSLQYKMGDCSLMACGHAHWLGIVPPAKLLYLQDGEKGVSHGYLNQEPTPEGYIDFDRRWYCCTGSFYKLFIDGISGYNEPFDPNDLGFLNVIIEAGKIVDVKEIIV
jgi:predicted phosphodiesterase